MLIYRNSQIKRSLLSNHSSSGSSSGTSKNQFSRLAETFAPDAFTNITSITPRTSFTKINYSSASMAPSEPRFVPSARPSISKNSRSIALFYPGVPIENVVPNPVYINNQHVSTDLNDINNINPFVNNLNNNNDNNNQNANFNNQTPVIPSNERLITSIYVTNEPNKNLENNLNNRNN